MTETIDTTPPSIGAVKMVDRSKVLKMGGLETFSSHGTKQYFILPHIEIAPIASVIWHNL